MALMVPLSRGEWGMLASVVRNRDRFPKCVRIVVGFAVLRGLSVIVSRVPVLPPSGPSRSLVLLSFPCVEGLSVLSVLSCLFVSSIAIEVLSMVLGSVSSGW